MTEYLPLDAAKALEREVILISSDSSSICNDKPPSCDDDDVIIISSDSMNNEGSKNINIIQNSNDID